MSVECQICKKCIMDTTDRDIQFENGVCNHCLDYAQRLNTRINIGQEAETKLKKLVEKIKRSGKNKKYDCVIGISGGVDSTYAAYLCEKLGLRPLAVHYDNGWDTELAVSNIEKVLKKLDMDLFTYVNDWEEFKDLQLSFLYASVPDLEIPTDHAIYAILMKTAAQRNIRYVITGNNFKTESIMPKRWSYGHMDWKYIKNIQKRFGTKKLDSFPRYSLIYLSYLYVIKKIRLINIFNYIDYDRNQALEVLEKELNWQAYGGKHHESIITRFLQAYILPKKFNIDKRRAHLSNLINCGLITREEALEEIKNGACASDLLEQDKEYVIKKFGLSESEFESIMNSEPKTFLDYKNNYKSIMLLRKAILILRRKSFLPK